MNRNIWHIKSFAENNTEKSHHAVDRANNWLSDRSIDG